MVFQVQVKLIRNYFIKSRMLGTPEDPGITPRSITELFSLIEGIKSNDHKIKISYIEVYNEVLRDLLSNSDDPIELREDPNSGTQVQGAKEILVSNSNEAFKLLVYRIFKIAKVIIRE
jgi:kinesin family member 18/19